MTADTTYYQTLDACAREAGILALARDYIRTQKLLDIQTRAVDHELRVWVDCFRMSGRQDAEDAAGKYVHRQPVHAEWRRLHAHNKSVQLQIMALIPDVSRQIRIFDALDAFADGGK